MFANVIGRNSESMETKQTRAIRKWPRRSEGKSAEKGLIQTGTSMESSGLEPPSNNRW